MGPICTANAIIFAKLSTGKPSIPRVSENKLSGAQGERGKSSCEATPGGMRAPMRMRLRADRRLGIERARRDDHFPSAASEMRQRRAASRAKGRRKAARRRQIKTHDKLLPGLPPELLRVRDQVGSVSAAGRLAAPRAVTMHKIQERSRDPIRDCAAQTTTAKALFHPWKLAMTVTNRQRRLERSQIVPSLDAARRIAPRASSNRNVSAFW
jgi:hypothetical protein